MNKNHSLNLTGILFLAVTLLGTAHAQTNIARTGRFYRGTGTDTSFQSFVYPLNFQKGVALDNVDGNSTNLFPGIFWGNMRYHYDATNPASANNVALRIPYNTPVVAFGSRVGGTPLYFDQDYHFGISGGLTHPSYFTNTLVLNVYRASDFQFVNFVYVPLPRVPDTNAWRTFLTNGYQTTVTAFGLTTTVRFDDPYSMWGVNVDGGCYHITHNATQTATNYIYVLVALGYNNGIWLTTDTNLAGAYNRLYSLEFQPRPPWRAIFLDQPQFTGTPAPSFYQGKSLPELLTNAPLVTNSISLTPSACTNLDASPELRRHPTLDQFVSDMRRDPLVLANYVHNEIELTDAIAYNDNGSVSDISINLGGVNRSALGTFMEKQGSPTEQCALLVYLLRQAGIPATYVFPAENGLKMMDTQLSKLLRMQIHGAINFANGANNQSYTTNTLIPVNYPWVAAYIGTNWVHLFPWLKDTEVVEGLNLYDYLPAGHKTSYQWIKDYLWGKTNVVGLSTGDDTPRTLFPLFVKQILATNSPGISLDDIGMQLVNRRHLYSRWGDFPRPPVVTNSSIAIESLGSSSITNVNSRLTNIFDTVSVTVSSVENPNRNVSSGTLRMVDLHNRKFLLRHERITSTTHRMILSLEPYRPDVTGIGNFANDPNLLKQQLATNNNNLGGSDDALNVQIIHKRHRSLPVGFTPPDHTVPYLGMSEATSVTNTRASRKGDLSAICFNVGRVTPEMLRARAQELWNMESTLRANPSATNTVSPDVYQGAVAYLMGMAYYEKVGRFDALNRCLHKVQQSSQFASGVASMRAKRNSSGDLPSGNIDLIQPSIDIFYREAVLVGNTTVHLDSGDDGWVPNDDYFHLSIVDGSAQEHAVINQFFHQTDAVSTVKLLQLAQAKSATNGQPGILFLDKNNYVAEGEKNYPTGGSIKLKNHVPSMWTRITSAFTYYSNTNLNFVQVYITPGPVTNQTASFKGMGALILEPNGAVAAIGEKNGGYGPNNPDGSLALENAENISVGVDSDNNYSVNLTPPDSGNHTLAPDAYANHNAEDVSDNATDDFYNYTGFQNSWTDDLLDLLLSASLGSQNLNFAQGVDAVSGDSGYLGAPTDVLNQNGSGVADPVHAVTGEFYINATDLALTGPMPLVISRNYSSLNLAHNQFGYGWKASYMPYLSINASNDVLYAAEPDGSVLAYQKTATNANLFLPAPALNPQLNNARNAGMGSLANRLLNRVEKQTVGPDTFYYLFSPDGSKRTFKVMIFSGGTINRTRPYLTLWQDSRGNFFSFEYGTNSTTADFAEVRRVQSSNGGFFGFAYDVYGHIVEVYAGDGRRLSYRYDQFGDLVTVTLPDQSTIEYQYQHLTQPVTNGSVVTLAPYSTHLVVQEIKPDGRTLKNEYDLFRRVTNQWSTVAVDLSLVRNATFIYSNNYHPTNSYTNTITGFTIVKDVFNNTNRYDYTNGLITRITDPLNQTVIQDWFENSETNKVGYFPRSLESRTDKRGLLTTFKYDGNGNVTNTVVFGDLSGDGSALSATNVVVYNSNNLPTSVIDPAGNRVDTIYDSQLPFLPGTVVRYAGSTAVSTNKLTYVNVTNTFVSAGITYTNTAFGLMQQQVRAFGSPDAATNSWTYDGRGLLIESVSYSRTGDPAVTNFYFYNDRAELVEKTDAAGRRTVLTYDALGRPIGREVFEANQVQSMFWEYSYFNDNGELVWSDGPRFNPEDYVWRDYDGAGRKIVEIRWRSEAKVDGSGVQTPAETNLYTQTFFQYDTFGNLVRAVDPRGAITTNVFDALGRPVQRRSFDLDGTTVLSSEGFAYEPGGLLRFHTNALGGVAETQYTTNGLPKFRRNFDGSTNAWRYYVDGRIQREIQGNGAYWETMYDDANRKTTRIFYSPSASPLATNVSVLDRRGNRIQAVDAAGNVFTNLFDGLDRLKTASGPAIPVVTATGLDPENPVYVTNIVQQSVTNFYDAAGLYVTNINALGEKTIGSFDALGRTIRSEIRSAAGAIVRETTRGYAQDHNSVTVTNGSGSSAIIAVAYTDNDGQNLLSVSFPNINAREFTLNCYDLAGNLSFTARASVTNGAVSQWTTAQSTYDGLNRVKTTIDRDNASTTFAYNGNGNLTNQVVPGGLQWCAVYNNAGQVVQDWSVGSGAVGTRTNIYTYYASGSGFAGLLQTSTDGRGVTCTHDYDEWLRPSSKVYFNGYTSITDTWQYDARGYATNILEDPSGQPVNMELEYDAYGQLVHQRIRRGYDEYTETDIYQSWDAAGRRTGLNFGLVGYAFNWRADGSLASVSMPNGSASYSYDTAGILTNRLVGNCATTTTSRDGVGRPLSVATTVNAVSVLTESLNYTGDGLLNAHTLTNANFNDFRGYGYASSSRRLISERLNVNASTTWTNTFGYDNGAAAGPGVLTLAGSAASGAAKWTGSTDAFSRVNIETNTAIFHPANGRVNGSATITASLDGLPMPVRLETNTTSGWPSQWYSLLELTPGPHQLSVYAAHPSGQFTTNVSVWFTNNAANETASDTYDAAGNLYTRIWKNASGQTNRTQYFFWDEKGRLWSTGEIDSNRNGYLLGIFYDALDRRIATEIVGVTNNQYVLSGPERTTGYFYDPLVEFQELGVSVNGKTSWKLYGPDLNGEYGGLNGVGGLDAVSAELNQVNPVISDARGNVLAAVTNGVVKWSPSRPTGYGAVPNYRPVALGYGADVVQASAWRGRHADISGLICLGARYYDPVSGRFISSDPVWNGRDPNYYSFAGGDPINYFDPSGRMSAQTIDSQSYNALVDSVRDVYGQYYRIGLANYGIYPEYSYSDLPYSVRLALVTGAAMYDFAYAEMNTQTFGQRARHFAADAVLNADLLQQSWYELNHPDFSSGWGVATYATAGIGLVAGTVDAAANVVTLGTKGLVTGGIKTGIKEVAAGGTKELAETSTEVILRQTGAGSAFDAADEAYNAIRASTTDVAEIAKHTGFDPSNVQKVKDHVFMNEHLLDRYVNHGVPAVIARFDSSTAIAEAWTRLRAGKYTAADVKLLKHEMAEAWYMRRHGPSYNAAHEAADKRFPSGL